jgi:hypothetical protein
MTLLMLVIAIVATIAIFATTTSGREIAKRIGFRDHVSGAATSEDVAYLLSACRGDRAALEARIAAERLRYPDLTEAEHYRRAIRKVFAERESSAPGTR